MFLQHDFISGYSVRSLKAFKGVGNKLILDKEGFWKKVRRAHICKFRSRETI